MRFGTFMFPMSLSPENDGAIIDQALCEAELAEEVGFDAIWLTEHHFGGTAVYADPVTFGAAVAARTDRVKIGFAVVQLALHHPVRLAAQTALLDNLSRGRLLVGTGRGSAYNHYEYIGFGTTLEEGRARLAESEDLLVRAWTTENLDFRGEFFSASFPMLRPRPYQKPHPPLLRAALSEPSVIAMAEIARPILIGVRPDEFIKARLRKYEETMMEAGFDKCTIEKTLDRNWAAKKLFVADTYGEAREIAEQGYRREFEHELHNRQQYNPPDVSTPPLYLNEEDFEQAFIVGTPRQAADHIAALRDAGVRNLLLTINTGQMNPGHVEKCMRLVGQKVLPLFR